MQGSLQRLLKVHKLSSTIPKQIRKSISHKLALSAKMVKLLHENAVNLARRLSAMNENDMSSE